ncbi:MAG TPA: hypothetical protein VKZ79_18735 [Alphaproteobacteria bacterium]|nr:hypothetical protein [Alphaproteobacteria bacterium]
MRRRTCLKRLNRAFVGRIRQLEAVAMEIVGKNGHDIDRAIAFIAIESGSAWSGFVREFYLSCAFLCPKTISGSHVTHTKPNITNERQALIHSIGELKGKRHGSAQIYPRDEPAWHEKRVLPQLSASLSLSNSASIINGLSYQTDFFDNLPTVRNFYAHRSLYTAAKIFALAKRKYGYVGLSHPNELVNTIQLGRPQTLLQEWLTDMKEISIILCR